MQARKQQLGLDMEQQTAIVNNKKVRKLLSHRLKGFGYVVLTHGGRIHHPLWQYSPWVPLMRSDMIRVRERESESLCLKGVKVY